MWLIDKVFQKTAKKDADAYAQYPAGFCNVPETYDKEHHAARYHFTQCPIYVIIVWWAQRIPWQKSMRS